MSMHKVPLSKLEEEGLKLHGLLVGKPSQLSDAFRQGIAWALSQQEDSSAIPPAQDEQAVMWNAGADLHQINSNRPTAGAEQ